MRWYVEISPTGQGQQPTKRLHVEADQWQLALQQARALSGQDGSMSNVSIELLDDGYRATDGAARLKYLIRHAPEDGSPGQGEPTSAKSEQAAPPRAPSVPPPPGITSSSITRRSGAGARRQPSDAAREGATSGPRDAAPRPEASPPRLPTPRGGRDRTPTLLYGQSKDGQSKTSAGLQTSTTAQGDAPLRPELPSFEILSRQEQAPTEQIPLTYREVVYTVARNTQEDRAEALLDARMVEMRQSMEGVRPGRLVRLAVFDHTFKGRPLRRPLITMAWKDWRAESVEVTYPLSNRPAVTRPITSSPSPSTATKSNPKPSPANSTSPAPATAPAATATASPTATAPATSRERAPHSATPEKPSAEARRAPQAPNTPPARTDVPAKTTAAVLPAVPPAPPAAASSSSPPAAPARRPWRDLQPELTDACVDLHFMSDPLEGADFVLKLVQTRIPSAVGLVSFLDEARRELVVVCQAGGKSALLASQPATAPLAQAAFDASAALVIPDAAADPRVMDARWRRIGITPKSVLCAALGASGRRLGLLELANPLDGNPFTDDEGQALTYLAEQLAGFLGEHAPPIDRDRIVQNGVLALQEPPPGGG
ncbi:GAF domain-containing protein [Chondromyces crocatus]|uniref:GAF domain-containing protein n=1 Tax=Chondromyces crocatus TaxID=52 RepID=A0A0K1E8X6_CHOCO|nr:GAF domain-containing protein [Chondromyces crocatus]AKT37320.1 uncharacterized protein CMC5_014530 [Chondromyces crocatus]